MGFIAAYDSVTSISDGFELEISASTVGAA